MTTPNYTNFGFERIIDNDDREEFDPRITPHTLANKIQSAIDSVISGCDDVDWSEDLITYSIIKELRIILMNYKIPAPMDGHPENKFDFEAYKLTGKAEQSHGDIAFIINRRIPGRRTPISGVAFYEAKASGVGYESHSYPSFKVQQLRRLVTNTPKLNYLIYNREKREVREGDWPISSAHYEKERSSFSSRKRVHALTIDANFLKQCRSIEFASLTVGQSFGDHFVKRVLSGHDLDYSRSVDKTIRRWLNCTRRSASLIISVSVHEETEEHFSTQLELPGLEKIEFPQLK